MSINVGEAVVRTVLQLDAASSKQIAADAEKTLSTSMRNVGRNVSRAGAGLTAGLSVPVLALGGSVIKMAADFEYAMLGVEAATALPGEAAEETAARMKVMEDRARELGSTTIFSSEQAARGMEALALAGFNTDQILESVSGTLALAATDNIDLALASEITAKALNGFGLEAKEAGRVADVLAKASIDTTSSSTELGVALKYSASNAKAAGLTIEQTAAALGLLANAGLDGSTAGTSLNIMLSSLQQPSDKLTASLKKFGIQTRDSAGEMLNLEQIFAQVGEAGPKAAGEISLAMEERAGRAFRALGEAGPKELGKLTTALEESAGTAQKVADIKTGGATGALEELSSAFEGLSIAVAESGLLQMFTDLVKGVTEIVRNIGASDPAILRMGVVIAGIAAAIGPVLVAVGAMISAIGSIAPVVGAIAGIANPIGLVVLAIAALAAAFIAAWHNSEPFRKFITAFGKQLQALGSGFIAGLMTQLQPLVDIFQNEVMPAFQELGEALEQLMTAITPFMEEAVPILQTVGEVIGKVFGAFVVNLILGVYNAVKGIIEIMRGLGEVIAGLFSGDQELWAQGMARIFEGVLDTILGFVGTVMGPAVRDALGKVFQGFIDWIKDILGIASPSKVFIDIFTQVMLGAIKGITDMISRVTQTFTRLVNLIVITVIVLVSRFLRMGRDIITSLRNGITATIGRVISAISSLVSRVIGGLRSLPGRLYNIGREAIGRIGSAIRNGISSVVGGITSLRNRLISAASGIAGRFYNVGRDIVNGMINGIRDFVGGLARTAADMARSALNAAKGAIGSNSPAKAFIQVGKDAGEGFALGMEAANRRVMGAAANMTGSTVKAAPIGAARTSAAGPVGSAAVGGGITVVNNNYGPQTGSARAQETNWSLRYATSSRRFGDPAVVV